MSADPSAFKLNAILCDTATTSEGKLFIHGGGWNTLNVGGNFPIKHPQMGLALVLSVPYTETNRHHRLTIQLKGEDGEVIPFGVDAGGKPRTTVVAQFNVGRPPHLQAGDAQDVAFAVNFNQMSFEAPGKYTFVLELNGTEAGLLPFRVAPPIGMNLIAN